jgi:hypothetical protein
MRQGHRTSRSAAACRVMGRPMSSSNTTGPTADDFYELIGQLAQYRAVAKILRSLRLDPNSNDAWRLCALMVAALLEGLQKLPRTKKTKHKWTIDDDSALELEMLLLHDIGGLSERKAIAKLAETGRFLYAPKAGRRFPQSTAEKQRTSALWRRWMDIKKRRKAQKHNLDAGEIKNQTSSFISPAAGRMRRRSTMQRRIDGRGDSHR